MSLTQAFQLANDSEFRTLVSFSGPPRAGRITALEASGQVRVEMDDRDGGDVLAWPLNGLTYAVDDIVYCLFAANSPDSAIVIGSKGSAPTLPDFDPHVITEARAKTSAGLKLTDDSGTLGLHVVDGGRIGAGTSSPNTNAQLHLAKTIAAGVAGFVTNDSPTHGALATWRAGLNPANYAADYIAITILGSGYNTSGVLKAKSTLLEASAANLILSNASSTEPIQICTGPSRTERMRLTASGLLGVGTATPQGILHAHDGVGGWLHWSNANVTNLPATILPDGAGDVLYGVSFQYVIRAATTTVAGVNSVGNGSVTDIACGANTFRFAVAASGLMTVTRVAGASPGRIALSATWL